MLIHYSNRLQTQADQLVVEGRGSGPDGLGRVKSGPVG